MIRKVFFSPGGIAFNPRKYLLFRLVTLLVLINTFSGVRGQFVFYDNFSRSLVTPGGNPQATYTSVPASGGATISIAGASQALTLTSGTTSSRTYISSPLSSYSIPFNTTLSNAGNRDTITWAFNAQTSRTTTLNGFGNSSGYGLAVILATTDPNLNSKGNGYAVVYGNSSNTKTFRLVKFNNGITGTVTPIISPTTSEEFTDGDDVVAARVTFHPATNTWQLFYRDDNTVWTNPLTGAMPQRGTNVIDNAYTTTARSHFGFFWNHTGTQSGIQARFDNFSVRIKPPISTPSLKALAAPNPLNFGIQWLNSFSASDTFEIYGSDLTGNVTVNAPTHFQVSNNNINWGSSASIPVSGGTLPPTPVYARFAPTSGGVKTGNISFTGGGVSSAPSVAVTGKCQSSNSWINPGGGAWNTASNWSVGTVPIDGDSVRIAATGTYIITNLPAEDTFTNLTIIQGANVTLSSGTGASLITLSPFNSTDTSLNVRPGATLILSPEGSNNKVEILFTGGISSVAGNLQCGNSVQTTNGLAVYNAGTSNTQVSGTLTLENSGQIINSTGNLSFNSGGSFTLNSGLAIPPAIWYPGSNCNIFTREASGQLTGLTGQSFHNFNVNLPGLSAGGRIECNEQLTTVNGNLHIQYTNWSAADRRNFILADNTQSITLTVKGNLIIDNNAEFEIGNSGVSVINLEGDLVMRGNGHMFKRCSSCNNSTINFVKSTGIQNYTDSAVLNSLNNQGLLIQPGAGYTINVGNGSSTNTLKLNTNLNITNPSTVNVSGNATLDCSTYLVKPASTTNTSIFTLNSQGTLRIGSAQGITSSPSLTGNIQTNSRNFNINANYHYTGTVPQTAGNGLPQSVRDLVINNSGGSTGVTLFRTTTVSNNLALNSGLLTTGTDSVIVNGTPSGFSASSYVNGILTRSFGTGSNLTRPFPIGNLNAYCPVTLFFPSISAAGKITVSTAPTDHPNISRSNFAPSKTVNRFFRIGNSGLGFTTFNATFQYVSGDMDAGINLFNLYAGQYNGTSWSYPSMGTVGSFSTQIINATAASGDFQLGECNQASGIPAPDSAVADKTGICVGESVMLTLFRGGISDLSNVKWYRDSCNGTLVASGNNVTISPIATTTYFGRFEGSNSCNIPSTCKSVRVEVSGGTALWLGINSNWNDPANWCPGVPADTSDVTLRSGLTNYPTLNTGLAGRARNIIVENGANLIVTNNTLQIKGSISGSNNIDLREGTLELAGSNLQTFGGQSFVQGRIRNLIINNPSGVNLSSATADTLKITRKLAFGSVNNCEFNTGNNLTLVSDSNGTAAVGDITNNGTNTGNSITGNVTVERYITQARKWQFLSVPTSTGQTIRQAWMEGANGIADNPRPGYGTVITDNRGDWQARGFDAQSPGGPSMKVFNPSTQNYDAIAGTSAAINNQFGYMAFIRGDRTATPSNTVRNRTILRTTGVLKQGVQDTLRIPDSSFVGIGNPFASAIDMAFIEKNCENFFYLWDPNLTTGYGVGGYQTFFSSGNEYYLLLGGGSYPVQGSRFNQIQSGQAFFVRGKNTASYVLLKETAKMADSNRQVMRPGPAPASMINMNIHTIINNSSALADAAAVIFSPAFDNETGSDDAFKMKNTGINVFLQRNGKDFAIEGRKSLREKDTFFLSLTNLRQADYEWNISMKSMTSSGRSAFLVDKFTKTTTRLLLQGNTSYRFSVGTNPGSSAADRFIIVFKQPPPRPFAFAGASGKKKNDHISLFWEVTDEKEEWTYEIERAQNECDFRIISENIHHTSGNGNSTYCYIDENPLPEGNRYRIKAKDAAGNVAYSRVITVEDITADDFVSIRPNPVRGLNARLYFSDPVGGRYHIRILNNTGSEILAGEYELIQGSREIRLSLPPGTAAGTYFLKVSGNSGNRKFSLKLILQ